MTLLDSPSNKKKNDYGKKYRGNPEYEAWHAAYRAKPETKAKIKAYAKTPKRKAYRKAYQARPDVIASNKKKQAARLAAENQKVPGYQPKPLDGLCQICRHKPRKLCLDHCHETGRFRGWICGDCNLGLGKFGDKAYGLRRAHLYLESYELSLRRPASYELLLACFKSGQVSERQWQEHLKDEHFAAWVKKHG